MQTARAHWLVESGPAAFHWEQQVANRRVMNADAPLPRPVTLPAIKARPAQWPQPCCDGARKGATWRR